MGRPSGFSVSEETKNKIRKFQMNYTGNPGRFQKNHIRGNGKIGTKLSEEHRKKLSDSQRKEKSYN